MYDFDKVKKSNIDLIEDLIEDTIKSNIQWYSDEDIKHFYCKKWVDKNLPENNKDRICVIFRLSDQEIEEEVEVPYQFQIYFEPTSIIAVDIYLSKNGKKEMFCKRITENQLKLTELLSIVNSSFKKRPKK